MADVVVERSGGIIELLLGAIIVYLYFHFKNSCPTPSNVNVDNVTTSQPLPASVSSTGGCSVTQVESYSPKPFVPSLPLSDVNAQSGRYIVTALPS